MPFSGVCVRVRLEITWWVARGRDAGFRAAIGRFRGLALCSWNLILHYKNDCDGTGRTATPGVSLVRAAPPSPQPSGIRTVHEPETA